MVVTTSLSKMIKQILSGNGGDDEFIKNDEADTIQILSDHGSDHKFIKNNDGTDNCLTMVVITNLSKKIEHCRYYLTMVEIR